MKKLLLLSSALLLTACAAEPGSEKWCEAKKEQPKSEWTMDDAGIFTKNCIIDGMEVGSEKWCEDLAGKPKGDWSASEASSYAKHCVM